MAEPMRADLVIELNVECPKCDHFFNLLDDADEAGGLLEQVIADERWEIDSDERLSCDAVCPECGKEFDVKGVNW